MAAGYSSTPLSRKLGLKSNMVAKIVNMPPHYLELLPDMPIGIIFNDEPEVLKDFIHFFTKDAEELENELVILKKQIKPNGSIWVSWPKKASRIQSDVSEDTIRSLAISIGLVDVKVCAVDESWSALKLVIPVKFRK